MAPLQAPLIGELVIVERKAERTSSASVHARPEDLFSNSQLQDAFDSLRTLVFWGEVDIFQHKAKFSFLQLILTKVKHERTLYIVQMKDSVHISFYSKT